MAGGSRQPALAVDDRLVGYSGTTGPFLLDRDTSTTTPLYGGPARSSRLTSSSASTVLAPRSSSPGGSATGTWKAPSSAMCRGSPTASRARARARTAAMSGDGSLVVVTSQSDLTAQNPDHKSQLFLAHCPARGSRLPGRDREPPLRGPDRVAGLRCRGGHGFPDQTFRPTDLVNRQQTARILYRLSGSPPFTPPLHPTFIDVGRSSPFFDEVEWAAHVGVVAGFPDGTFRPRDQVNRQQLAGMLHGRADPDPPFVPPGSPTFADVPTTSRVYDRVEMGGCRRPDDRLPRRALPRPRPDQAPAPRRHPPRLR